MSIQSQGRGMNAANEMRRPLPQGSLQKRPKCQPECGALVNAAVPSINPVPR